MMNDSTGPGYAMMNVFYSKFIEPHLKKRPSAEMYDYFHHQAWIGWVVGVNGSDIERMLFVQWICSEILKNDPNIIAGLISPIINDQHDTQVISASIERKMQRASTSDDIEEYFIEAVGKYKTLYERQYRAWGTVPYYFAKTTYKDGKEHSSLEDYFQVGASAKHDILEKERAILHGPLQLNKLAEGLNRQVRNAGGGHDRYEISDDGKLVMKPVNPRTGASQSTLEFTKQEFLDLIKECEKTIWVIKMGILLFLENNPEIHSKIEIKKTIKRSEIKALIESKAKEFQLEVSQLKIHEDRNFVEMELKHKPRITGTGGQILMGNGEAYDIVHNRFEIKFRDQIFGLMQHLMHYLGGDELPCIQIKLFDSKGECISDPTYSPEELKKLMTGKKDAGNIPSPSKGMMTEITYELVGELKVRYGMGEKIQAQIDKDPDYLSKMAKRFGIEP